MVRKFFPLDKNYLLEEAQFRLQDSLLAQLVSMAREAYEHAHNPLGLNDVFSERILAWQADEFKSLYTFYQNLAAVYRFKYGQNQLDFLWDGRDHAQKYESDWSEVFLEWGVRLCRHPQFVQAVLDLTVFLPPNNAQLAENRMTAVMQHLFELKFHKQKGIVQMKVA